MNFLYTFLSSSIINEFKSNNNKFHKSLSAEMGKLGLSNTVCGCTRQGLKVIPCVYAFAISKIFGWEFDEVLCKDTYYAEGEIFNF